MHFTLPYPQSKTKINSKTHTHTHTQKPPTTIKKWPTNPTFSHLSLSHPFAILHRIHTPNPSSAETTPIAATRSWLGAGAVRSASKSHRRSNYRLRPQDPAFAGAFLDPRSDQPGQYQAQPRGAQPTHRAVHFRPRSYSQQGGQRDPSQQWAAKRRRMPGHHNGCPQHGPDPAQTAQYGPGAHSASPSLLHFAQILERERHT